MISPALFSRSILLALLVLAPQAVHAQEQRPIPYPVIPIPAFERAVEQGTRTSTGEPGPRYWTNRARYDLQATISPWSAMLRGTGTAVYYNNSPDTLEHVYVHLRQNLHAPGAVRNRPQELTGGVHVSKVAAQGMPLVERRSSGGAGFSVDGTVMDVWLPEPIAPRDSAQFEFAWSFEIPEKGAPRMGHDGEVFYLGYWYPHFAVYDDVHGWIAEQYQGDGEFYMDYADYDVAVTVPESFLVAATGELVNPDAVLSAETLQRLNEVASSDEIYSIVGEDERMAGLSTADSPTGALTWRFHAEDVRDFAFGTSDAYVWDAALAETSDGRHARVHTMYRPAESSWERSAEFARFAIEFLSEMLIPYVYPQMTVVEGIIGGGMEYPMITLIGGERTPRSLFGTTFHEISHMWSPMLTGHNEKHYAWMDEGLTSYNTKEGSATFWSEDMWNPDEERYYGYAGTGDEVESMRHADQYPYGTGARSIASYNKPAVALHALEWVLGEETFDRAYREYFRRWAYKHPYPYDLFNTFEDVAGEDLDWFWTSLFFETWTLDHAVASVESRDGKVIVTVEDLGLTPLPVEVEVTYDDGSTTSQVIPVAVWLTGERRSAVGFPPGSVTLVALDPGEYLPDVDRTNNVWKKGSSKSRLK